MTDTATLTLGALHRGLRGRLGESGPTRILLQFEQRTSMSPKSESGETMPGLFTKRAFRAEIDLDSTGVARADLQSTGMTTTPHDQIVFSRVGNNYWYSVDGLRFGRFNGVPELFDIAVFENLLDVISVRDVTIERGRRQGDVSFSELDVDLDVPAFRRLLRVFGGDSSDAGDDITLDSYSVHLAAGGDLTIDYWWELVGDEKIEDEAGVLGSYDCRIACHVTLRLMATAAIGSANLAMAKDLPTLSSIDDVWALARETDVPRPGTPSEPPAFGANASA